MSQNISSLIWGIADDVLRGTFKPNEYGRIILPFVVLRRLDCVLENDKKQAMEIYNSLKDSIDNPEAAVLNKLKLNFFNISNYDLEKLKSDPTNIKQNFENYIQGYSENVRDIIKNFNLQPLIDKLDNNDKLYLLIDKYTTVDLHPDTIDNHQMGTIYEELLRKFSEMTNEESGDHFTPRDIVQLLVTLVFGPDKENLQGKGLIRTIYDPCCGTGGLLSIGKQWVKENINSDISIELFGQELNDQTYAICKSDQLISGENPENIHGPFSTLTTDQLKDNKFDYIIANPPYGVSWKSEVDKIKEEAKNPQGRFSAGLPRVSDGSLLFLQHMISKFNERGSRLGIVLSASPLYTGGPNSGEAGIRKWIIDNDYLECIVKISSNMFFNTMIPTYVWIISNKKNKNRKNKIQLIDASSFYESINRNLGFKNRKINDSQIHSVFKIYEEFENSEFSVVKDKEHFKYRKITIYEPEIHNGNVKFNKSNEPVPDKTKTDEEKIYDNDILIDDVEKDIKQERPDAWIDRDKILTGYEISFNKEFFNYEKPKSANKIIEELNHLTSEINKNIKDLTK